MSDILGSMRARSREFASIRLPEKLKATVLRIANTEQRTLSQMLRILVEEALERRFSGSGSKAAD